MTKQLRSLISIIVSLALLGWVIFIIDFEKLVDEFTQMRWWVLVPATLMLFFHYWLRAIRWRFFLPRGTEAPLKERFDAIMIGNLGTYILPLRAGEIIRPWFLAQRTSTHFGTGFASVFIERFFDLAAVLISFGLVAPYFTSNRLGAVASGVSLPEWVGHGANALIFLASCILLVMLACCLIPQLTDKLISSILDLLPSKLSTPLKRLWADFQRGVEVMASLKAILIVSALTALVWCSAYALTMCFLFLIPAVSPSILMSVTVSVVIALAVAAPSAPGFLGVYQAALVAGFALFTYPPEQATAYAVSTHLLHYVIFVIYGMWVLARTGIKLGGGQWRGATTTTKEL